MFLCSCVFDSVYPHSSFNSFFFLVFFFYLYLSSFFTLILGFLYLHFACCCTLLPIQCARGERAVEVWPFTRNLTAPGSFLSLTHMYNSVRTGRRDARTVRPSTGLAVLNKHFPFTNFHLPIKTVNRCTNRSDPWS